MLLFFPIIITRNPYVLVYIILIWTLQISIGWLSVISLVIPLALKVILPVRIIPIGKIL